MQTQFQETLKGMSGVWQRRLGDIMKENKIISLFPIITIHDKKSSEVVEVHVVYEPISTIN